MEQFSLEKWLQYKSRKIRTRDGKDVEIIYTNSPVPHHPIVGFIDKSIYTWTIDGKLIYGKEEQDKNDLFFTDEEEELTEFEEEILNLLNCATPEGHSAPTIEKTKEYSQKLLDLARKELQPEFDKEMDKMLAETDKVVYQKGREDALKSLDKREMVSEDLEEACDNYYDETWDEHGGIAMVVNNCHDIWFPSQARSDFFKAGSEWQRKKDQEIDKLTESPDLDEASWKYSDRDGITYGQRYAMQIDFKAGAKWQKHQMKETLQTEYEKGRFDMREEMMKDAVETTIVNDWQYGKDPDHAIIPAIHQRIEGCGVGDKVKIIIVKTERL